MNWSKKHCIIISDSDYKSVFRVITNFKLKNVALNSQSSDSNDNGSGKTIIETNDDKTLAKYFVRINLPTKFSMVADLK